MEFSAGGAETFDATALSGFSHLGFNFQGSGSKVWGLGSMIQGVTMQSGSGCTVLLL